MSELPAVYIACASGNNPQTDVAVRGCGDLIQLLGHPQMTFTPNDALALARAVSERAYPKLHAGGTGLDPDLALDQEAELRRAILFAARELMRGMHALRRDLARMLDDGK
jgi:hypothetical protein